MGRIIAVGHTAWKMKRLLALIAQSDPGCPYKLFTVFNGDGYYTANLDVPNDPQGRDVAMYNWGLRQVDDPWAFFLNDDVCHITDGWLQYASECMQKGYDCVGQPNLSHWVDYDKLGPDDLQFHQQRGRDLKFIRTSNFACKRKWFDEGYQAAYGYAQKFEKGTLRGSVTFFPSYDYVYDGNTAPYV